jgi:hypothetical protein
MPAQRRRAIKKEEVDGDTDGVNERREIEFSGGMNLNTQKDSNPRASQRYHV